MLVLLRKLGEQIRINKTTELTILHIHGNRVTLGISAPADVRIQRMENATSRERPLEQTAKLTGRPAATYDEEETFPEGR